MHVAELVKKDEAKSLCEAAVVDPFVVERVVERWVERDVGLDNPSGEVPTIKRDGNRRGIPGRAVDARQRVGGDPAVQVETIVRPSEVAGRRGIHAEDLVR